MVMKLRKGFRNETHSCLPWRITKCRVFHHFEMQILIVKWIFEFSFTITCLDTRCEYTFEGKHKSCHFNYSDKGSMILNIFFTELEEKWNTSAKLKKWSNSNTHKRSISSSFAIDIFILNSLWFMLNSISFDTFF